MHVDFCEDENLIRVEGPVEELELVKAALEQNVREIESKMDSVEIKIDPQFHRHIIGKAGANGGCRYCVLVADGTQLNLCTSLF